MAYTRRTWNEGDIAQFFPRHIYIRPQPCTIKEVDDSGTVRTIFFHERRIMPGCEDWGIHDKSLSRDEGRFLEEYVIPELTLDDFEEVIEWT